MNGINWVVRNLEVCGINLDADTIINVSLEGVVTNPIVLRGRRITDLAEMLERDFNQYIRVRTPYAEYHKADVEATMNIYRNMAMSLYGANSMSIPAIQNVIFNDPATIVFWADGTKTVVKCQEGDIYSPETGLAMAISKKALGNQGNYCEVFKKWLPEEDLIDAKIEWGHTRAFEEFRDAMHALNKRLGKLGEASNQDSQNTDQ